MYPYATILLVGESERKPDKMEEGNGTQKAEAVCTGGRADSGRAVGHVVRFDLGREVTGREEGWTVAN